MPVQTVRRTIRKCRCLKCKHAWEAVGKLPRRCPNCYTVLWNRTKKLKPGRKVSSRKSPARRGAQGEAAEQSATQA